MQKLLDPEIKAAIKAAISGMTQVQDAADAHHAECSALPPMASLDLAADIIFCPLLLFSALIIIIFCPYYYYFLPFIIIFCLYYL
eukprot:SAG31_NODE_4788_length_2955_cov_8.074656_1_plen_84_part_10